MKPQPPERQRRFVVADTLDSVTILVLGAAWLSGKVKGVQLTPANVGVGIGVVIAGLLLFCYDCCLVSRQWNSVGWSLLAVVVIFALCLNL